MQIITNATKSSDRNNKSLCIIICYSYSYLHIDVFVFILVKRFLTLHDLRHYLIERHSTCTCCIFFYLSLEIFLLFGHGLHLGYTIFNQIKIIKVSKYVFEGSCFAKIQLLMTNFQEEHNVIFLFILYVQVSPESFVNSKNNLQLNSLDDHYVCYSKMKSTA